MAFESLTEKLQNVFKNLRGKGRLSEEDVKASMKEVRMALLEADVNFRVVKQFVRSVEEKAIGQDVMNGLNPGQMVVKIVNEELISLMGGEQAELTLNPAGSLTVLMMCGLQGSGKTTSAAKIAAQIRKKGRKPLLVACDVYRPAAIKQLQVVGEKLDLPVFTMGDQVSPVEIAKKALEHAKSHSNDVVIIDTAGRLHVDEVLMQELKDIKTQVNPQEILLVVDSMTGQDAVNVSESFNEILGVDGVVLTKLDGDTRGGAALSIRAVTQKPIKFIGMGEKLDNLEPFYPDRMASRILGMGDVLSLIEKAESALDLEKAKELGQKLKKNEMDFEDFLMQLEQVQNLGPLDKLLELVPGMGNLKGQIGDLDSKGKEINRTKAIIQSMTLEERRNPQILNASRKKRIARGSGTSVQDVNRLIKQFNEMKKMMKMFQSSGMMGKMKKGGFPGMPKLPF